MALDFEKELLKLLLWKVSRRTLGHVYVKQLGKDQGQLPRWWPVKELKQYRDNGLPQRVSKSYFSLAHFRFAVTLCHTTQHDLQRNQ